MTNNKIYPIYFSCNEHFKYLSASLNSLSYLDHPPITKIFLYIDKDDFLTRKNIKKLNKMRLNIDIRKSNKVTGWGKQTVRTEIDCFKEVSREIGADNYIVKVDSDVLFISDDIFSKVANANEILIGQKETCWQPFEYVQGGCYFIRNSFLSDVLDFDQRILDAALKEMNENVIRKGRKPKTTYPEDMAISKLVESKTTKIRFIDFYLPIDQLNTRLRDNYSVIHFQYHKHKMMGFFREVLRK